MDVGHNTRTSLVMMDKHYSHVQPEHVAERVPRA
jgi:hypothetical protein